MQASTQHAHVESTRVFMMVWGWLLLLTVVETSLAYQRLNLKVMLAMLLTLSVIKASLIMSFFMHLRYERRSLALTLLPALAFVIGMMLTMFPDSLRLLEMKPR